MELDTIDIHGLAFDSVIGAYPSERIADQRVLLDVSLGLDTRAAAFGDIARTVDYARLIGEIKFLMQACRFQLLETAAEALCRYMLAPPLPVEQRAQVQRVRVTLGKPSVFASLCVTRHAHEYMPVRTRHEWGACESLVETKDLGIYRLSLAAQADMVATWTDSHILHLGGGAQVQNRPFPPGGALAFSAQSTVRLQTEQDAAFVVVARPALGIDVGGGTLSVLPPMTNYYPPEHALPHDAL